MLPSGITEERFLAELKHVGDVLSSKFRIPGFTPEDIRQEIALLSWEALSRFDPNRSNSLSGFLYRNAFNRLTNKLRDEVFRNDPPCRRCAQGDPCGVDGQPCDNHTSWLRRNQAKAALASAKSVEDEGSLSMVPPTAEDDAEVAELMELLDENLTVEERRTWLRLKAGDVIPVRERQRLKNSITTILAKAGVEVDVDDVWARRWRAPVSPQPPIPEGIPSLSEPEKLQELLQKVMPEFAG